MKSIELFGTALRSFFEGNDQSKLIVRYPDRDPAIIHISVFFRKADELQIDKEAISLCRGRILDIGAGTGDHALFLQGKGLDVTAIDISKDSCEIMRKRGVKLVACCDFSDFESKDKFDTILLLGRSIGMVSNIDGFLNFLRISKKHLTKTGRIIFNSVNEPSKEKWRSREMQFEYEGQIGDLVNWFDIGEDLLFQIAEENGYYPEIRISEKDGNYLAVLENR